MMQVNSGTTNQKYIKIMIVSPIPPPYSGPEVMTKHLLDSPLKERFNLIHFNISKKRAMHTKARFDLTNIVYGLIQPCQLLWLMLKQRPELVYTNLAQNLGGFLRCASFIMVAALFNTRIVVRVMGDGFAHFYTLANPVLRWFINLTLKRIDRFIVRAEVLKKQFAGVVPSHKVCVVYSGIETQIFNKPRARPNNDNLHILFVGYLTKAKGALDLLQAIPIIAAEQPNITFQLMGSKVDVERNITYVDNPASNEAILQRLLTHKEVSERVELLGIQVGEEKVSTFVNADIFVLPSYSEAFPTVVLEAMAAGLPVIATPVGALPEVFDERHIFFVRAGNVPQLAEAILQLARDPNRRKTMATNNREIVQQHFNLEAYAERVNSVFETVLAKR